MIFYSFSHFISFLAVDDRRTVVLWDPIHWTNTTLFIRRYIFNAFSPVFRPFDHPQTPQKERLLRWWKNLMAFGELRHQKELISGNKMPHIRSIYDWYWALTSTFYVHHHRSNIDDVHLLSKNIKNWINKWKRSNHLSPNSFTIFSQMLGGSFSVCFLNKVIVGCSYVLLLSCK